VFLRMWLEEGVVPDRKSYNALMNASSRVMHRSDGRLAQFFLAFMLQSDVPPEVDSFNIAIRGALVERDTGLREVEGLLDEMQLFNISANENTFRTILRRAINNRRLGNQLQVNRLLQKTVDAGARPSAAYLQDVIEDRVAKGFVAQGVWMLGLATGYELMPVKKVKQLERLLRDAVQANSQAKRISSEQHDRMLMSLQKIHHMASNRRFKKPDQASTAAKSPPSQPNAIPSSNPTLQAPDPLPSAA